MISFNIGGVGSILFGNLEFSFFILFWELVCKDFKNVKIVIYI